MNLKEELLRLNHSNFEETVVVGYNKSDILNAMQDYAEEMCEKQKEIIADKFGKQCDNCGNIGYTVEHEAGSSYPPIQVQCEFCHTEPLSKFNILNTRLATEEVK